MWVRWLRWLWGIRVLGGGSSSLQTQDGRPDPLRPTFPQGLQDGSQGTAAGGRGRGLGVVDVLTSAPGASWCGLGIQLRQSASDRQRTVVGISLRGGRVYRMISTTP